MNSQLEGSRSVSTDLVSRLAGSPDIYPLKLDFVRQAVLLIQFDAAAYQAASFLDDRVLTPVTKGAWVPAGQIVEAVRRVQIARPLHFIFHTGHVGSTLLSRLLEETRVVLSLREPLPLRTFAEAHDRLGKSDSLLSEAQFVDALDVFMRLWSRGYDSTRCVILKATSSAGRLAAPLLTRNANARAIYLNMAAEPFLATLLAGANSPADLRGHGPERVRRLQGLLQASVAPLHQFSIGELAALSWLSESLTQRDAITRHADRIMAMDFDRFLAAVPEGMGRAAAHLGVPHDAGFLEAVARSPALTRYSKAPEHAYSPQLRAEILADSRQRNSEEIAKGTAWLERMARAHAAVGEVLTSTPS